MVEIAEGVYIDFYVLHADAGGDPQSTAARIDNYRQLTEHINTRPHDRAVIVVGDFNARIPPSFETDMLNNLIFPAGLSDSWVELCNNGVYSTEPQFEEYEVFESIDKVMYKNGGGVEFTLLTLSTTSSRTREAVHTLTITQQRLFSATP